MIHRVRLKIGKNMMRVKVKVQQLLFLVLLKENLFYIPGDSLKLIIAQYLKHDEALILKQLYIWVCYFCCFSNKTAFKKGSNGLAKER